jgi:Spy/CpxP family protein refolding chaperone
MMKHVLGLGLLIASLAPVAAWANPDMGGGGFMHGGMHGPFRDPMLVGDDPGLALPALLQGVGLTEDQKKQVQDILKTNRATLFPLFGQLRAANQALADKLISTGPLTKNDLQPLMDQVMKVRGEIMSHGLDVALQVRGLLSQDQLTKAVEVKTKMRDLRNQMRQLLGEPETPPLGGGE